MLCHGIRNTLQNGNGYTTEEWQFCVEGQAACAEVEGGGLTLNPKEDKISCFFSLVKN